MLWVGVSEPPRLTPPSFAPSPRIPLTTSWSLELSCAHENVRLVRLRNLRWLGSALLAALEPPRSTRSACRSCRLISDSRQERLFPSNSAKGSSLVHCWQNLHQGRAAQGSPQICGAAKVPIEWPAHLSRPPRPSDTDSARACASGAHGDQSTIDQS